MSRGYWITGIALVSLLGACILGYRAYTYEQHQDRIARYYATHQEKPNRPQYATERAAIPAFAEGLISNPEPTGGSDNEKRDLAAQESMSVWAFWLLVVSTIQTVVTAVGVVYVALTLRESKNATAAAAAVVTLASNQLVIENRPWIQITKVKFIEEASQVSFVHASLTINQKNIGHSPAMNIIVYTGMVRTDISADDQRIIFDRFVVENRIKYAQKMTSDDFAFPGKIIEYPKSIFLGDHSNPKETFSQILVLACCVCYRSNLSDEIFHTANAFSIKRGGSYVAFVNGQQNFVLPEHSNAEVSQLNYLSSIT